MKRIFVRTIALIAIGLMPVPALAGIYGDDVTRCIVKSTSDEDQIALIKWIFAAMALHPSIKAYANISDDQRAQFDKQTASIVTRLLTQTCHKETVAALKYEGSDFLGKSFSALGEVAMGGMMTNPQVATGLSSWAKLLDKDAIAALGVEAGRPMPPPNQ